MMKKFALVLALVAICAAPAFASLVVNGDFSGGLTGWSATGGAGVRTAGEFGLPDSPDGTPMAGVISSWGGDWNAPLGTISQTVNFTGPAIFSGEMFAAAHAADAWRNCAVEVLFNGTVVASVSREASATLWAQDFPWTNFIVPVTGIGANTVQVNFTVHYAEWTWVAADNLQIVPVPEPGSFAALASGLIGMAGFAIRRRK